MCQLKDTSCDMFCKTYKDSSIHTDTYALLYNHLKDKVMILIYVNRLKQLGILLPHMQPLFHIYLQYLNSEMGHGSSSKAHATFETPPYTPSDGPVYLRICKDQEYVVNTATTETTPLFYFQITFLSD